MACCNHTSRRYWSARSSSDNSSSGEHRDPHRAGETSVSTPAKPPSTLRRHTLPPQAPPPPSNARESPTQAQAPAPRSCSGLILSPFLSQPSAPPPPSERLRNRSPSPARRNALGSPETFRTMRRPTFNSCRSDDLPARLRRRHRHPSAVTDRQGPPSNPRRHSLPPSTQGLTQGERRHDVVRTACGLPRTPIYPKQALFARTRTRSPSSRLATPGPPHPHPPTHALQA